MGARRFTDLDVWQRADKLSVEIYNLTEGYPPHERFGLVSQMRRAVTSISANIVEGFTRYSPGDHARFYEIAKSSAEELRQFVMLSVRLHYLKSDPGLDDRIDALCAKLYRLRQSVLAKSRPPI